MCHCAPIYLVFNIYLTICFWIHWPQIAFNRLNGSCGSIQLLLIKRPHLSIHSTPYSSNVGHYLIALFVKFLIDRQIRKLTQFRYDWRHFCFSLSYFFFFRNFYSTKATCKLVIDDKIIAGMKKTIDLHRKQHKKTRARNCKEK